VNLNFSGASSFTVSLSGWPARIAIAASLFLGAHRTLALCKSLPFSKQDLGLLVAPIADVYREGNWALVRHIDRWYSFQVLRANSDVQLNALVTGVLNYKIRNQ
jgi:hypothetical protein